MQFDSIKPKPDRSTPGLTTPTIGDAQGAIGNYGEGKDEGVYIDRERRGKARF